MMILNIISNSLDVLNKSVDLYKKVQEIQMNFTLPDEVKKINAKLDQDITRKIKSGYESIGFALGRSPDSEFRNQDIEDARNYLSDCLNLSKYLETDGIPNSEVMAVAHYGLTIVYNLKGDRSRASYHILCGFQVEPRKTRELAPEIYGQLFRSHCGDRALSLDPSVAYAIASNNFSNPLMSTHFSITPNYPQVSQEDEWISAATEVGKEVLKGAAKAGGVALWIFSGFRIPPPILGGADQVVSDQINNISADGLILARNNQRTEKEAQKLIQEQETRAIKQDNCVTQKASEYLSQLK